jgi:predicted GIY-YIG superfamily endonuclease
MALEQVNMSKTAPDALPRRKAVYAIFARSKDSGKPINCRYVGETDNLQERMEAHLRDDEPNACLRQFMQSDKIKLTLYELMPDSTSEERREMERQWIKKYNPTCNKSRLVRRHEGRRR